LFFFYNKLVNNTFNYGFSVKRSIKIKTKGKRKKKEKMSLSCVSLGEKEKKRAGIKTKEKRCQRSTEQCVLENQSSQARELPGISTV
jgi:hypothetical protein